MLVDRTSGGRLGVALFDTEEAMRKADEAMNAGPGNAGSRTSVEFYEVPLHTLQGHSRSLAQGSLIASDGRLSP